MRFALKTKITTPLFEETRRFYENVFGMVAVERWDDPGDKGVILAFDGGKAEAFLEIYNGCGKADFEGLNLQFKVDSLDGFIEALDPAMPHEGPRSRPWGATYLYLRDPNGILVIVYEGGF